MTRPTRKARAVAMACMFIHAVSLLALAYGTSVVIIVAFAFAFAFAFAIANGLAWGARVPVVVTMRADYFGARSFGSIMGLSTSVAPVASVASVAAPLLAGCPTTSPARRPWASLASRCRLRSGRCS